jgi:hypothetical protein
METDMNKFSTILTGRGLFRAGAGPGVAATATPSHTPALAAAAGAAEQINGSNHAADRISRAKTLADEAARACRRRTLIEDNPTSG